MPSLLTGPVVAPERLRGSLPDIAAGDIVLRRWTTKDAAQLVAAFRDEDIKEWHLHTLDSEAEAVQWMNLWRQKWRKHLGASWAISPVDDRTTVLGQVGFRDLFPVDGMAECSYWMVREWRRQGIATRAADALADWALNDLGLERLELVHSTRNDASCQVALRAGFEVEGIKRRLQRHRDGWHDMHLHSRVRG